MELDDVNRSSPLYALASSYSMIWRGYDFFPDLSFIAKFINSSDDSVSVEKLIKEYPLYVDIIAVKRNSVQSGILSWDRLFTCLINLLRNFIDKMLEENVPVKMNMLLSSCFSSNFSNFRASSIKKKNI
jgi:hypothetical protein